MIWKYKKNNLKKYSKINKKKNSSSIAMLNIPLDIFIEEKESYLIMTIRENVIDSRHKKILTFVSIDSFRQAKFDGGF